MNIDELPQNLQQMIAVEVVPDCPVPGPCWTWTSAPSDGYGQKYYGGRPWPVHRLTYTLLVNEIPEGLQVDHLCLNKACCNPAHLEPVTPQENSQRYTALKTHCPNGHPFSGSNLRIHTKANGRTMRVCKECSRERWRAWKKRQSQERAS